MTIASIKARLEAATPGPWTYIPNGPFAGEIHECDGFGTICVMADYDDRPEDFDLIAHAPTDLRALLKVAEAAKAECEDQCPLKPGRCLACRVNAALAEVEGIE